MAMIPARPAPKIDVVIGSGTLWMSPFSKIPEADVNVTPLGRSNEIGSVVNSLPAPAAGSKPVVSNIQAANVYCVLFEMAPVKDKS